MRPAILCCAAVLAAGALCLAARIAKPPVTIAEYDEHVAAARAKEERRPSDAVGYPRYVVAQYNLRRVLDTDLPLEQRQASMQLLRRLRTKLPGAMDAMAMLMDNPKTPASLHEGLLAYLLEQDYPHLTEFVIKTIQDPDLAQTTHDALLGWLQRNAKLEDIVKLWAARKADDPLEKPLRAIAQRLGGGKAWDDVLLASLGRRGFQARGSALHVLAARMPAATLKQRIRSLRPRTEALAAMQTFILGFDYVPGTKAELVQAVHVYRAQRRTIDVAAQLCRRWRAEEAYAFNIRDYYLIRSLAGEAQAARTTRTSLVQLLTPPLTHQRSHVVYRGGTEGGRAINTRFSRQVRRLSIVDLWNLVLLNEMLSQARTQAAMTVISEQDRQDKTSGRGGLVFYKGGRAQPLLYPPQRTQEANDLTYVPIKRLHRDQENALCRFITHFNRVKNMARVGPSPAELQDARGNNYYGLTITSLDARTFTAHYFTPDGVIVSLGKLPFGKVVRRAESRAR